jgi:hypothetical protein
MRRLVSICLLLLGVAGCVAGGGCTVSGTIRALEKPVLPPLAELESHLTYPVEGSP